MPVLTIFVIQVVLYAGFSFYFARQKKPLRAVSFYIYLSILLAMGGLLGSVFSFPITDNIKISGGSMLYGAFMMTTILFVIIENNVGIMRHVVRLVIIVNILKILLFSSISWALRSTGILNPFNISASIFSFSVAFTILGGVLIIFELILMIFIFERIKSKITNIFAISILYILVFILILCLDGILFPVIAFAFNPNLVSIVIGGIPSKFIIAAAYSLPMLLFLAVYRKGLTEYVSHPLVLRELLAAPQEELIEEIQRQRASLAQSEEKYRHLAESINDVFFSLDANMRFTYWNKASEREGYRAEEVLGKRLYDLFPQTKDTPLDKFYQDVLHTGKAGQFINQIQSEGQERFDEIWAYPFKNEMSVIVRDITERKRLEMQLLQTQKMESIGQLAGGIAHDFNNILTPIIGYVELGMKDLEPDDKLYTNLKRVREAAERAAGLTRQILAFSRKQVLEMQVLDISAVVADFEKMIQRLIGEDVEFRTILAPAPYLVKADKGQIEQVLLNLVINARDAMPMGGKLTIETCNAYLDEDYVEKYADSQPPGHYLLLAVSDTGQGMDAETKKHIFEPFFTTKANGKGTGLGLATVFGIVKQHQGNIWIYSEPEKGTTFKIYLPQVEGEVQTPHTTVPEFASNYRTETILVVEDEEIVRNVVCETLRAYGYRIIEAKTPDEGLALASTKEKIHLLLTDVIMPVMNGRELHQKVAVIQPDIKVLFMSGYTDDVIVHHGILDEGINFLQKPFSVQSLTQKVNQVLS
ncbi:MAG: ATP-binding protein [Pyrinomonadaceae bacterium]